MFLSYTHQSIDLYGKSIEWFLYHTSEAATQRCSMKKMLWKYAASLHENTHAEVRFQ